MTSRATLIVLIIASSACSIVFCKPIEADNSPGNVGADDENLSRPMFELSSVNQEHEPLYKPQEQAPSKPKSMGKIKSLMGSLTGGVNKKVKSIEGQPQVQAPSELTIAIDQPGVSTHQEDKQYKPLTEKELSDITKQLFSSYTVVPPLEAQMKLESLLPYADQIKNLELTGTDIRRLYEFSTTSEAECDSREYFRHMKLIYRQIEKDYPSLTDYMFECIRSYQFHCHVPKINQFILDYKGGWDLLKDLNDRSDKEKGITRNEVTRAIVALKNAIEYGGYKKLSNCSNWLQKTCPAIKKLAHELNYNLDPNLSSEGVIKTLVSNEEMCRLLEDGGYQAELQYLV